jgi:YidC/Oxa1 family membrane protein insertase
MNDQKPSFFDTRTLIAIAITMLAWMGWQSYMSKKYPHLNDPAAQSQPEQAADDSQAAPAPVVPAERPAVTVQNNEIPEGQPLEEKLIPVENPAWKFLISSRGMGLKDITLQKFTDREKNPIKVGAEVSGRLSLETNLMGRLSPLHFDIEKVSDTHFIGKARAAGLTIVKTMVLDPEKYQIDTQVAVQGQSDAFLGVSTHLVDTLMTFEGGSFFSPQVEHQDMYIWSPETSERITVNPQEPQTVSASRANVVAIGTHYFTQAMVDRSNVLPDVKAENSVTSKSVMAVVNHPAINKGTGLDIKYSVFIGPKDLDLLKSVDANLTGVVNFGFFSVLGRPILKMLKWFYAMAGNWGVAIILLTLLVRFLVLPFNVMSFKSMKAMQVVQPQIQALKERYKNDPNKLNQEMLVLFKTHKVNPLGGCLPVLLQIPIFFALYQVLGQSVELYQAPFMLWIQDLSHKDPYFVLPILMGITMFFQTKITPTSMDPNQAKVMMFLPLIFTFFMLALPSGLTLYIFISTLFGIGQQLVLNRGNMVPAAVPKPG